MSFHFVTFLPVREKAVAKEDSSTSRHVRAGERLRERTDALVISEPNEEKHSDSVDVSRKFNLPCVDFIHASVLVKLLIGFPLMSTRNYGHIVNVLCINTLLCVLHGKQVVLTDTACESSGEQCHLLD